MTMSSNTPSPNSPQPTLDRRRFLAYFSAMGLSTTLLPGVLWTQLASAAEGDVTPDMVAGAARIAGLDFDEDELEAIADDVNRLSENFKGLRALDIPNGLAPALQFNPVLPGMTFENEQRPFKVSEALTRGVPADLEDLAFWPVTDLAPLLRQRKITSTALTQMYIARLKRYNPVLNCVVTLTEDLALEQAKCADAEITAGNYRGPLHGIPWGAKDLLAVKGYKTTWGATPYKDQVIDEDATVVTRLEEAGAVLVAKLTLGALAMGDEWYGGRTNCPWNPERGSSGSSAGPGAATAAGLVGFSIGSETNGSITSPARVNGITGLRPTFGRVSRAGAMALCWSMDKLGPMCRSVEDCALVLNAIMGPDDKDPTVVDLPFNWDPNRIGAVRALRVGYVPDAEGEGRRSARYYKQSLDVIRGLGIELNPIEIPDFPIDPMEFIIDVESAAAFDELTRSNRDDLLVNQEEWPKMFRQARMVPAVEYLQANRARRSLMEAMDRAIENFDVYVVPSGHHLMMGNLTGHPIIALPNGIHNGDRPTSISFVGHLYGEAKMMALAKAFQDATNHHKQYPTAFAEIDA